MPGTPASDTAWSAPRCEKTQIVGNTSLSDYGRVTHYLPTILRWDLIKLHLFPYHELLFPNPLR
jgi:hypothetical protein